MYTTFVPYSLSKIGTKLAYHVAKNCVWCALHLNLYEYEPYIYPRKSMVNFFKTYL